jgi:hypothetical protein
MIKSKKAMEFEEVAKWIIVGILIIVIIIVLIEPIRREIITQLSNFFSQIRFGM